MSQTNLTPCSVLFDFLKKNAKMSYMQTASLILSDKSNNSNQSPLRRSKDRSWLSRYIVHAPVEAIHRGYFSDFGKSALRVIAQIRASNKTKLDSKELLDLICDEACKDMLRALSIYNDNAIAYQNLLDRLSLASSFTLDERTEIAMVLFITAACTASVSEAIDEAMNFARNIRDADIATPLITPSLQVVMENRSKKIPADSVSLGLMRVIDGYMVGSPSWIGETQIDSNHDAGFEEDGEGDCGSESIFKIGSLAVGSNSLSDVEPDVSGVHLEIVQRDGKWLARDRRSKNGSILIDGSTHETKIMAPPECDREPDYEFKEFEINPGDELVLGADTRFVVITGLSR